MNKNALRHKLKVRKAMKTIEDQLAKPVPPVVHYKGTPGRKASGVVGEGKEAKSQGRDPSTG